MLLTAPSPACKCSCATWHADHSDERESNKLPLPSFRYRTVLTACTVDRAPTHAMPPPTVLPPYLLVLSVGPICWSTHRAPTHRAPTHRAPTHAMLPPYLVL